MKEFIPFINKNDAYRAEQVIDLEEERKLEREALGLVELHDFIKSHPDAPVKEIAKFMPPVDSRVVSKAIQMIALREEEFKKKNKK